MTAPTPRVGDTIHSADQLDALWEAQDVLIEASGTYANGMGTFSECWARPVPEWAGGERGVWEVLVYGQTFPESLTTSEHITTATVRLLPGEPPTPPAADTPAIAYTPRGFAIRTDLTDRNGALVRVQESSLATEPCVWIFTEGGIVDGNDGAAHLTVEQARTVRDALTAWLARTDTPPPEDTRARRAPCGCDLSVGPNALHIVDGHEDPPAEDTHTDVTEQAEDVIAEVRDAYPRRPDDAPSAEVAEALRLRGLLATAPTTRDQKPEIDFCYCPKALGAHEPWVCAS